MKNTLVLTAASAFFIFSYDGAQGRASAWPALLYQHQNAIGSVAYAKLVLYQRCFAQGAAPKIADDCVKRTPIHECGEKCVDLRTKNNARIQAMTDAEVLEAHYCQEDIDPRGEKCSHMRTTVYECLVRMIDELDRLAPEFGYEAGELEIRLFEGLRDIATQRKLFDTKMAEIAQQNPTMTQEQVYQETCTWVSPYKDNVPTHSTGAAVDIHLWSNKKQAFCDMGRFNHGGAHAPTFSDDNSVTALQQNNRLLFLTAATKAGLTNYLYEFWHFSYGDRYAAYLALLPQAIYGAL